VIIEVEEEESKVEGLNGFASKKCCFKEKGRREEQRPGGRKELERESQVVRSFRRRSIKTQLMLIWRRNTKLDTRHDWPKPGLMGGCSALLQLVALPKTARDVKIKEIRRNKELRRRRKASALRMGSVLSPIIIRLGCRF
jgi:hypothetical protein